MVHTVENNSTTPSQVCCDELVACNRVVMPVCINQPMYTIHGLPNVCHHHCHSVDLHAAVMCCVTPAVQALLKCSTFPLPPHELIQKAKQVLKKGVHKCQDQLAEDFAFTAPFIGPLGPADFASTMETLNLDEVFPDLQPRVYHMRVDPLEPNRVWFTTRCAWLVHDDTADVNLY